MNYLVCPFGHKAKPSESLHAGDDSSSIGLDLAPASPEGDSPAANVNNIPRIGDIRGPWVRAGQLSDLFSSWDLAFRCTQSGWLKPIIKGKRRTIYRLSDVLSCMRRIENGELPPARSKKI